MKHRGLKILLISMVVTASLLLGGVYGILHTTAGARLLLSLLEERLDDSLKIEGISGNISSGLDIAMIKYRDESKVIRVNKTRFAVVPEFFPLQIQVRFIEVASLHIRQEASSAEDSEPLDLEALSKVLESLAPPFPIILSRLELDIIAYSGPSGTPVFSAQHISSALQLDQVLDLKHLALESKKSRLELEGKVGLSVPFPVSLNGKASLILDKEISGTIETFEIQGRISDYEFEAKSLLHIPNLDPVSLELSGNGNETSVELTEMQFLIAQTGMRVNATATINLDQGVLEADLNWSDLAWPLASGEAQFLSPAGEAHLSGSPDNWALNGDTTLQTKDFPPGRLRLEANGNRESATVNIVDGQVLGGDFTGKLEFGWTGEANWSAKLNASNMQTDILLPNWPGSINTRLTAQGSLKPFRLNLDILQLDGKLRQRPLTASGQLYWQGGRQLDADIQLASGNSKLVLQGELFAADGLGFSVSTDELGYFLASGTGSVQAHGRVCLLPDKPYLRLDLEAEKLGWNDLSLDTLSIHNKVGLSADTLADLLLVARKVEVNGLAVDEISLDLFADETQQSASLTALYSSLKLSVKASGTPIDWQHLVKSGGSEFAWSGHIDSMALSDGEQISLQLEKTAPLHLSANSARLEDACIGTQQAQSICFNTQWQRFGAYSTHAVLHQFPLQIMQVFLDKDLTFSQQLSGDFSLNGSSGQPLSSQAQIEISPGVVGRRSESSLSLNTGTGIIGFNLDQGKLVTGALSLPLPGNGKIDIDFQLPDISAGENTQIASHAEITLNKLDLFSPLLPFIDHAGGQFYAQLDVSGSALHPNLSGSISIENGLLQHDASGLELHDIQLAGHLLGGGKSHLSGRFMAREGNGELDLNIDLSDIRSPRFELALTGKQLTLFDSPELLLVAEPDIKLAWGDKAFELNGSILIPRARIAPRTIPVASNPESPDLVIVAGEAPKSDHAAKPDQELAIRGDLEITLGDQIELVFDLAEATLGGSAIFSWQDKLVPMAEGEYHIVGEINAFGQQLQITQGSINFPGIPADNPHLDIRAERKIYGNSEIRRAGVFINGTLKRMVVEPYTDPMTTRERAQTLLITGSDFNMDQGVGAVDIGTYIAPRVYLSYGIGVFEDENVISLRYDLGKRWGIKATSGQRTTGIDINYVIER